MAARIPADDACCRRCRSVDAVARAADALARSCGLAKHCSGCRRPTATPWRTIWHGFSSGFRRPDSRSPFLVTETL